MNLILSNKYLISTLIPKNTILFIIFKGGGVTYPKTATVLQLENVVSL